MCWWRRVWSHARFGVVAVPDLHVVQADGPVEMLQRLVEAFFADDVVSRDVGVAGVDAAPTALGRQAIEHSATVRTAPRENSAPRILDQNGKTAFRQIEALRAGNRGGGAQQALLWSARETNRCSTRYSAQRDRARSTSPRKASMDCAKIIRSSWPDLQGSCVDTSGFRL